MELMIWKIGNSMSTMNIFIIPMHVFGVVHGAKNHAMHGLGIVHRTRRGYSHRLVFVRFDLLYLAEAIDIYVRVFTV